MKSNALASLLVALLALSLISAAIMTITFRRHTAQARSLQGRLNEIQNTERVLQLIANESVEYSRKNPALAPILSQFGLGSPTQTTVNGTAQPKSAPKNR